MLMPTAGAYGGAGLDGVAPGAVVARAADAADTQQCAGVDVEG